MLIRFFDCRQLSMGSLALTLASGIGFPDRMAGVAVLGVRTLLNVELLGTFLHSEILRKYPENACVPG
jgi:hypothetical protein